PHVLALDADAGFGLRRDDLISKDGDPKAVAARLAEYRQWQTDREEAITRAQKRSLEIRTVTELAYDPKGLDFAGAPDLQVIDLSPAAGRPFGPRFGSLVHATLATAPFDADEATIH